MVYSNRFVVCVLVNGRPAKERADGIVPIPFGTEYVLRFRNKNNRRAVVKFTIDGENVSGNGYIIPAHSAIDIKRHAEVDRAFKFVDLDSDEAIDQGKNGPNDDGSKGVIVAKFYLEKEAPKVEYVPVPQPYPVPYPKPYPVYPRPWWDYGWKYALNDNQADGEPAGPQVTCSNSNGGDNLKRMSAIGGAAPASFFAESAPRNRPTRSKKLQDGATVEGALTGQNFTTQYIDYETDHVTIRLTLKEIEGEQAAEIIQEQEVEEVLYCTNCGAKKARKNDKFCGACGQKL